MLLQLFKNNLRCAIFFKFPKALWYDEVTMRTILFYFQMACIFHEHFLIQSLFLSCGQAVHRHLAPSGVHASPTLTGLTVQESPHTFILDMKFTVKSELQTTNSIMYEKITDVYRHEIVQKPKE